MFFSALFFLPRLSFIQNNDDDDDDDVSCLLNFFWPLDVYKKNEKNVFFCFNIYNSVVL